MSLSRLVPFVALLLAACAGWEAPAPAYAPPPPVEGPTPSHYAPPPPVDTPPSRPDQPAGEIQVAIASVQLFENCPDPPEADDAAEHKRSAGYVPHCSQSTVQLAVRSDRAGRFRVEAVRVLDGVRGEVAGSSTLRAPTQWRVDGGAYTPWDQQVAAGKDLQISYKLGDLELSQAGRLAGPQFDVYSGPFVLELDVAIDGRRRTIRSSAFGRQRDDMVET